ncbi:MAG: META domain-containing protein [Actinomycetes bacterium]
MKRLTIPAVFAAVLVAAVVTAVAACGGSGASGHTLDGTSWRLSGWTLNSLAPDQFTITASFAGGRISGSSAVNTYGGTYSTGSGGAFAVGQLASTEMAGPEPAMRAEGAYMTLLQQARSCKVVGDTLTLYDGNGNESLIFAHANL